MKKLKKKLFPGINLTMPKKLKGRDHLGFSNIHSAAKHQKNAGGTLWGKNFRQKMSRSAEKN